MEIIIYLTYSTIMLTASAFLGIFIATKILDLKDFATRKVKKFSRRYWQRIF